LEDVFLEKGRFELQAIPDVTGQVGCKMLWLVGYIQRVERSRAHVVSNRYQQSPRGNLVNLRSGLVPPEAFFVQIHFCLIHM